MPVLDGRHEPGPTLPIDVSDRGLLLGDGLFETIPVFAGRPWRGEDHLGRLAAGCERLGIPVGRAALDDLLARTLAEAPADAALRLTVTRGPGPRGLCPPADPAPTLLGTAAPWSPDVVARPVRLALAEARRNDRSPTSRLKTLAYLDAVLETRRALARGFDDALFLDTADRVACATMANVFVVHRRRLKTPPLDGAVLPGVARARVLATAAMMGLETAEAPLGLADLAEAEEIFLTNSLRLVLPVTAFEDRVLPPPAYSVARLALEALAAEIARDCGRTIPLPG